MRAILPALIFFILGPFLQAQQLSPGQITILAGKEQDHLFQNFRELLQIPNDAHYPDKHITPNITWIDSAFQSHQFINRKLSTDGPVPLLLCERQFPDAEQTVLVYLQADGQPVDPTRWNQPDPYNPVVKKQNEEGKWIIQPWESLAEPDEESRIYARSTSDSKGPIAMLLSALNAMDKANIQPNYNLKLIIDFEEELGSPRLPDAVEQHSEALAADMLIILDGPPHVSNEPSLKFGARGISTITLTVFGPRAPQHSGHYGNYAPNPALRLAQLLASMKDEEGRVTIPGFYEGIELDKETREILAAVPDNEEAIMNMLGIGATDKVGNSYQEAIQYPSLNVRGLSSGWVGNKVRTIVPATATAEIDVRLVKESDPERLIRLIRNHIEEQGYYLIDRAPTDAERQKYPRIAFFRSTISYQAFRTDFDTKVGEWLTRALTRQYGKEPIRLRTSGGSIPIAPFVTTLGIPAVTVPTVNPDNNQHSPNEFIRVGNLLGGVSTLLSVLNEPL
jgi:acetylornithine deacetylase/succinyl-diaminopimelate desuccinylase-like protein